MSSEVGKGPNRITEKTWLAEAAITKNRVVVAGTAADEVLQNTVAGAQKIIGIARETAAITESVSITEEGSELAEAAGAITVGALLKADTAGKVTPITVVAGGGTAVAQVGTARGAAAADGDLIVVRLTPGVVQIET